MKNSIKLVGLASILACGIAANVAQAAPMCDNFRIKITNQLTSDDLKTSDLKMLNAKLDPNNPGQVIPHGGSVVYVVNSSQMGATMEGYLQLKTTLTQKTVHVGFNLENKLTSCSHTDRNSFGDYKIENSRHDNEIEYIIKQN